MSSFRGDLKKNFGADMTPIARPAQVGQLCIFTYPVSLLASDFMFSPCPARHQQLSRRSLTKICICSATFTHLSYCSAAGRVRTACGLPGDGRLLLRRRFDHGGDRRDANELGRLSADFEVLSLGRVGVLYGRGLLYGRDISLWKYALIPHPNSQ